MGFIGVIGIPEMLQLVDSYIGNMMKVIPVDSLPEEAKMLLDKAARQALIGFDLTSTAGWSSIGIDISAGIYMVFDAHIKKGMSPCRFLR